MPGVKISNLTPGDALRSDDSFPVARGGATRKIEGSRLLTPETFQIQSTPTIGLNWNSNTKTLQASATSAVTSFNTVNSPTINLNWNSSTRTLSADASYLLSLISSLTASSVPTGAVMTFSATSAPTGWLALSGQTVSRTSYSALWSFAQSSGNIVTDAQWTSLSSYGSFSQGDGSSTFRIPDLRGHFVRGSGTHTDGTAAGAFGVKQDDALKSHTHSYIPASNNQKHNFGNDQTTASAGASTQTGDASTGASTETRPKNIALLYCIKT